MVTGIAGGGDVQSRVNLVRALADCVILVVGILCLLFDLVYIALLVRDRREQNGVESQPSVAV